VEEVRASARSRVVPIIRVLRNFTHVKIMFYVSMKSSISNSWLQYPSYVFIDLNTRHNNDEHKNKQFLS
jgi:hypothetical protein